MTSRRDTPEEQQPKPGDLSPETKAALEDYYNDYPAELEEPDCPCCEDEGGDPLNDFCLPCPICGRP